MSYGRHSVPAAAAGTTTPGTATAAPGATPAAAAGTATPSTATSAAAWACPRATPAAGQDKPTGQDNCQAQK